MSTKIPLHSHVQLSVQERDTIATAYTRMRRFAALIGVAIHKEGESGVTCEDVGAALVDLTDLIQEDAMTIEEAFMAADAREKGGA